MRTAGRLRERLEAVYRWYEGMVRPETGTLEYLYLPERDAFVRESSPIRDIASVWDVEVLGEFLGRDALRPVTDRSLRRYAGWLVERDGVLVLDEARLGEPSSIAHSAFLALALLRAPPPRDARRVAGLVEGIVRQQRPDGSYRVHFGGLPEAGEELYAGEAMLALAEAHRALGEVRWRESVERGVAYYDARYFGAGRVADDLLVFFANWQSQACRALWEAVRDAARREAVAGYVFRMHDRIVERGFYEAVERDPEGLASVEVACAVEGLADAYALTGGRGERAARYRRGLCAGLEYLLRLQSTGRGTARERGGFGMSLGERAQRIDVTGHAASAFMKCAAGGVECGARAAGALRSTEA